MILLLLLLKMSLEDYQTLHVDLRDIALLVLLQASWLTPLWAVFFFCFGRYTNPCDIIVLSLLCTLVPIDLFLVITGALGIVWHVVHTRRHKIPFITLATAAFYITLQI